MAKQVIIQGTVIDFPEDGASPTWAPALVQFAEAVESALANFVGTFDVSPQIFNIDAFNNVANQDITNLSFSTTEVRSVVIEYYVFRQTDSTNASESGVIYANYNDNLPTNSKWELSRQFVGDGEIDFNITDTGQVQFSTTALAGSNHTGNIGFSAKTLEQE